MFAYHVVKDKFVYHIRFGIELFDYLLTFDRMHPIKLFILHRKNLPSFDLVAFNTEIFFRKGFTNAIAFSAFLIRG